MAAGAERVNDFETATTKNLWSAGGGHDPAESRGDAVDVEFVECFAESLTCGELVGQPELAGIMLLQRGSRRSVPPVTEDEWHCVFGLARGSRR